MQKMNKGATCPFCHDASFSWTPRSLTASCNKCFRTSIRFTSKSDYDQAGIPISDFLMPFCGTALLASGAAFAIGTITTIQLSRMIAWYMIVIGSINILDVAMSYKTGIDRVKNKKQIYKRRRSMTLVLCAAWSLVSFGLGVFGLFL